MWTDKQIMKWSRKTFFCTLHQQKEKVKEELSEVFFELSDLWIAKLGVLARGGECESFEEYCKAFNVRPSKLRRYVNEKMRINSQRVWENKNGVIRHK